MLIAKLKRVFSAVTSATVLFGACRPKAQPPDAVAIELGRTLVASTYRKADLPYPLPYRLYVPSGYDPKKHYPLVLYLHGSGGNGDDNLRHLSGEVREMVSPKVQGIEPFFVLVPQCPEGDEWVNRHDKLPFKNYDQSKVPESPASQMTFDVIRHLQTQYSLDADRLYITGYSMGGSGTWDFITRHPGIFAAAVPVTGVNDPSRANVLGHLAIWAFHGENDPVSPVSNTREMVDRLRQLGSKVRFSELKQVGHDSSRFAYEDIEVYRWILAQRKQ